MTGSRRIGLRTCLSAVALSGVLWSLQFITDLHHPARGSAPPALQGQAAVTHLKVQGLHGSLEAALKAARYRVRPTERSGRAEPTGAYYASNPAHHFTAHFTPEELTLAPQPQTAAGNQAVPDWRFGMKLEGYGYGERIVALREGTLRVQENRVDFQRAVAGQAGIAVTEWYLNNAAGLEQGFTLHQPPEASGAGETLRLRLQVSGDVRAELAADGESLWLKRRDGEVALGYGGLAAWDASGKKLGARMGVAGDEVWLEVEEAGAAYPVTIDPTFVEQQKLTAGDGAASDSFGSSVAISGATIVVGAPGFFIGSVSPGSGYVFERQGGSFVEQQKLSASDGTAFDGFGHSVAISGATIVVGAPGDDIGSNEGQGSVYVFERQGGSFVEQQKLTASDGATADFFGHSVAISGTTIVVGAPGDDIGSDLNQGSAYVFERQAGSFGGEQKLTVSDGAAVGSFGFSVAISETTIVVGAPLDTIGTNFAQGSAYVFERQGGSFVKQQELTARDGAAVDLFGESVAISDGTIVVGAPGRDIGSNDDQGSVYVFEREGGSFVEQQKLTASDGVVDDVFGSSVAISEATIVVGAPGRDIGSDLSQGSVYVFEREGGRFVEQRTLTASDGAASDFFGDSVAIRGATIVVGSFGDDTGSNLVQGSAYVFAP
jgi:hypothetical protein